MAKRFGFALPLLLLTPAPATGSPLPPSVTTPSTANERAEQPIWIAISRRDYAEARRLYQLAKPQGDFDFDFDFEKHLRGLASFWKSVSAGLAACQTDDDLSFPTTKTVYRIADKTDTEITLIPPFGDPITYPTDLKKMPTDLAVALFHKHHPTAAASVTEPFQKYDSVSSQPSAISGQPSGGSGQPSAAEQREALAEIRKLFEAQYEGRTPQAVAARAALFLKTAEETKGNTPARYVLLAEAKEAAISIGDVETTFNVLTAIAERYGVDESAEIAAALKQLWPNLTSPASLAELWAFAQTQIDTYIDSDQYTDAEAIIDTTLTLARKARQTSSIKMLLEQQDKVRQLKIKHAPIADYLDSLPIDLSASNNAAVGQFLCFEKGDFSRGLPYLAASNAEPYQKLAEQEIASPQSNEAKLALADGWLSAAGENDNENIKQHAAEIYGQIFLSTSGLMQAKVKTKLDELSKGAAANFNVKQIIGKPIRITWSKPDGKVWDNILVFNADGTYVRSVDSIRVKGNWIANGNIVNGVSTSHAGVRDQFVFHVGGFVKGMSFQENKIFSSCNGNFEN